MKNSKKIMKPIRLAIISLAIVLGFSGCAALSLDPVHFAIPARPALEVCPDLDPPVSGVVTQKGTVELAMEDAFRLMHYIKGLELCSETNLVILNGHIEKLENRLRALGGK